MKSVKAILLAAMANCALLVSPAHAQSPLEMTKPTIKMVAGLPPGGPVDIVARAVSARLSQNINQPVIVDNKVGATGTIAATQVVRSAPDGNTILIAGPALALASSMYEKLPYDAEKDLTPITMLGESTMVLVVNPQFPATNVRELVAALKAAPDKYSYGSFGIGSTPHVTGELFKQATGVDMLHVPYRGSAQALTDVMGGQIQLMFEALPTALPHIRSGKLRALAVTANKRAKELPDVPTVAEAGVPGFNVTLWWGIFGPPKMPPAIANRLSNELNATLAAPEVFSQLTSLAVVPTGTTPEAAKVYFDAELQKYNKVVRAANIRPE